MKNLPVSIDIDPDAGFCTGVRAAVNRAETLLDGHNTVYCLGNLVHNEQEIARLRELGLETLNLDKLAGLPENVPVIIRAHGEPPSTYAEAEKLKIDLSDATCLIVRQLQRKVKQVADELSGKQGRIIIYGKPGHPEIIGLLGQADGRASVVQTHEEVPDTWLDEPLEVFAQTTANAEAFNQFTEALKQRAQRRLIDPDLIIIHQTICRQMKNRKPSVIAFAQAHDVVIFVSGSKSSNGRFLAAMALQTNPRTYVVTAARELKADWFANATTIGVSGATSSPQWLLEQVADEIRQMTL